MKIENNNFILEKDDLYCNYILDVVDQIKTLFMTHFPPKKNRQILKLGDVKKALNNLQKKNKGTIEELIFVGELLIIQDALINQKTDVDRTNRRRLLVQANAFFTIRNNCKDTSLQQFSKNKKFVFTTENTNASLDKIIDLIQSETQALANNLNQPIPPKKEKTKPLPPPKPAKLSVITAEQKLAASKARNNKRKEEFKSNRGIPNSVSSEKQEGSDKNVLVNAFESLIKYASDTISLQYNNKIDKYFNPKDDRTLSLVRSIVGAKKTNAGIAADIATNKYSNQSNSRQAKDTINKLIEFDTKKEKITWAQIWQHLGVHQSKQDVANSTVGKLASKFKVLDDLAKKNLAKSKNQATDLIEEKAMVSREVAKLSVSIRNTHKRLGFLGWFFHPMQTYRNFCAKDLLKELRNTQHTTRQTKKGSNSKAWDLTVFKYWYIGKEAMKLPGTNDDARRLLTKSFNELEQFDAVLDKLGDQPVTPKLAKNINKTIDNLMDAEARLKMEI